MKINWPTPCHGSGSRTGTDEQIRNNKERPQRQRNQSLRGLGDTGNTDALSRVTVLPRSDKAQVGPHFFVSFVIFPYCEVRVGKSFATNY
jgi:hypothetical protein